MSDNHNDDLIDLLCGSLLGEGTFRKVFEMKFDKTKVVKRDSGHNWSNIAEWEMYNNFRGTPIEPWLAPCYWISPLGLWMVQARTTPIQLHELPKEIPAIFTDTKVDNWGWLDGKPVCHDYGNNRVFCLASGRGKKMVKAHWYDRE